jgi:hypothetical protein
MRYARLATLVTRIKSRFGRQQSPKSNLRGEQASAALEADAIINANVLANLPDSDRYIIVCLEKHGATLCAARRPFSRTSE